MPGEHKKIKRWIKGQKQKKSKFQSVWNNMIDSCHTYETKIGPTSPGSRPWTDLRYAAWLCRKNKSLCAWLLLLYCHSTSGMRISKAGRGVGTTGGWAQVSYKIDKNTCNLSFGMESLDEDDVAAGALSKNQTILANVIHAGAASTKIAAELGYITTSYKGGDDQNNLNVNLALQYVF